MAEQGPLKGSHGEKINLKSGIISPTAGKPGGFEQYSEGSSGSSGPSNFGRPGGPEEIKTKGEGTGGGYARPGGFSEIKEK